MQDLLDTSVVIVTRAYLLATEVAAAGRSAVNRLGSRDERGEGVISAAIAVLIMAILGGLMFAAYQAIFKTSSDRVTTIVNDLSTKPAG
jgi:hypothetical protein